MNSKAGANWSNGLTMSKQWESPMACSSLFNTIGSSSATTQMVLFGCFMIWSTKHDEALPQGRLKKHAKVRKKFGIRELPCGGGAKARYQVKMVLLEPGKKRLSAGL